MQTIYVKSQVEAYTEIEACNPVWSDRFAVFDIVTPASANYFPEMHQKEITAVEGLYYGKFFTFVGSYVCDLKTRRKK